MEKKKISVDLKGGDLHLLNKISRGAKSVTSGVSHGAKSVTSGVSHGVHDISSMLKSIVKKSPNNYNSKRIEILKEKINTVNKEQKNINNKIKEHKRLINEFGKTEKGISLKYFLDNPKKKIKAEEKLIEKLKKECVQVCDKYNDYYKVSYINLDKFKDFDEYNVEIIDLIANEHFPHFLSSLSEYSVKLRKILADKEITKASNSKCDNICLKKKLLFKFLLDNYITDNALNIILIIAYKFYDSFKGEKTIVKNKNGKDIDQYMLFTKKDDEIIVDFEAIGKLIKYELDPLRKVKNNNKEDDIKRYFFVSVIIFLFNYLYDEHKNFNKLSKENYDSFNKGMSYTYYIFVSEERIKTIVRSARIALIKEILAREEFNHYSDFSKINFTTMISKLIFGY